MMLVKLCTSGVCELSVTVELVDGCVLAVDSVLLAETSLEPLTWFKVITLRCITVDCVQRLISWNFISASSRQCCLMAPHEGDSPPIWSDDLASVFQLASTLIQAASTPSSIQRQQQVVQRTWATLLQSYLLPLLSFTTTDLPTLHEALSLQSSVITHLDNSLSDTSTRIMEVKQCLSELRCQSLPLLEGWIQTEQCSRQFLEALSRDIRELEDKARTKIESSRLSSRLVSSLTTGAQIEYDDELVKMLSLRSQLHHWLVTKGEGPITPPEAQVTYCCLHKELQQLKDTASNLSNKKVAAQSVRECLSETVSNVGSLGHSSTRPPTSTHSHYQTTRDKLVIVLRDNSTAVASEHKEFCAEFRAAWLDDFTVIEEEGCSRLGPCQSLVVQSIKEHFDKMLELIATHFGNHDKDFRQRMQMAYEKVFFDLFHKDIMNLYQSSEKKFCESLQLNALGGSLLTPDPTLPPSITSLFPPREFEVLCQLYTEIKQGTALLPWQQTSSGFIDHFGGMTFDLEGLFHVHSPLEKMQLLTSAFRKVMTSLSRLQLGVVSCDDLLPVLVMALIRIHPTLLAHVHVNTMFLEDFIASFLTTGWHGYSLTSFSSAIKIISEM